MRKKMDMACILNALLDGKSILIIVIILMCAYLNGLSTLHYTAPVKNLILKHIYNILK